MTLSGAWRRCLRLVSFPPESSRPADGCSPSRRRTLSGGLEASSRCGSAGARGAGRWLRRGFAAALLLAALPSGAAAQSISANTIYEGQTRTFTVTGIPNSWTGEVEAELVGNPDIPERTPSAVCLAGLTDDYNAIGVDICPNQVVWDPVSRVARIKVTAARDRHAEGNDPWLLIIKDSADRANRNHSFPITITEHPATWEERRTHDDGNGGHFYCSGPLPTVDDIFPGRSYTDLTDAERIEYAQATEAGQVFPPPNGLVVNWTHGGRYNANGTARIRIRTSDNKKLCNGVFVHLLVGSLHISEDKPILEGGTRPIPLAHRYVSMAQGESQKEISFRLSSDAGPAKVYFRVLGVYGSPTPRTAATGGRALEHATRETRFVNCDSPCRSAFFRSRSTWVREDLTPTVNLTVGVSQAPSSNLTLNYTLSGTATRGSDYTISGVTGNNGTVTVPANATSATIPVMILDDGHEDSGETIKVSLQTSGGYRAIAPESVTITIRNDDPLVVDNTLPGTHPVVKYASLVKSFYDRITDRHVHGDSASGGWNKRFLKAMGHPEYAAYPQAAVTVADATRIWNHGGPGANTAWDGTVDAVTYAERYFAGQVTTEEQNTPVPEIAIAAGSGIITEGTDASFILTANPPPAAPLDVTVTVATEGAFGITGGERTVTIPTTGSTTLTLATDNDGRDETDGSVTVTVGAAAGYTVGAASSGTVAIADDDVPVRAPEITIAAGTGITEGEDAVFTVTATPPPSAPLDVIVTVAASGEYGIAGGERTVTVPTTGSSTLTLATTGDDVDETDGSAIVTISAGTGYTVGTASSGTVAIADDDGLVRAPEITIAAGTGITEGEDAVFTVTAIPPPSAPLSVIVTVAAEGAFGIAGGAGIVIIPTTGIGTLTLPTTGDEADEADGSVTVTVAAGSGYTVGTASSGTVAIADNDVPEIVIAAGTGITEGGSATFTLTATPPPAAPLEVTVTVAASGDYGITAGERTVTIPTTGAYTLTLATTGDDVDETDGSVSVTISAGTGYTVGAASSGTVAVADNDTAGALPVLSVESRSVQEGNGKVIVWATIDPFPSKADFPELYRTTRLKLRTIEGTAWDGVDYVGIPAYFGITEACNFHTTLAPNGKHGCRIDEVTILDDSHDDGGETFQVEVGFADSEPAPLRGLGAARGTITIENSDPLPAAYLARFGRTVAEQALDGIAGRMSASRAPGMQGTVAGQSLSFDPAATGQPATGATPGSSGTVPADREAALAMANIARGLGADASAPGSAPVGPGSSAAAFGERFGTPSLQSRSMTARDALLGSSFSLTAQKDGAGGSLAFWGRASQASFDGAERGDGTDIRLDGTVTTGMLGADYARGKWLVGLALTQSSSEGSYAAIGGDPCPDTDGELCDGAVRAGDGDVEASLTAAIPYAALQVSERLKLWGAAGYGTGEVTLKTMEESYKADTSWTMAAAGVRGDLLQAPEEGSGPALALTSDALWARTSSDRTRDLAATDSDATRLRLGLEGSYRMALDGEASLTPKLEIGARHDGGDAETGFGVEIGGGVQWVDPSLGLSLDVSGRTLLAHENDDLKDRGLSASLAFDPAPATGRGPSLSLRQEFGGQANGGLDALFAPAPLEDRTGSEATSRWAMEAAWGFPAFGGRFTGSPHVGLGLSTGSRDYSIGWRLAPEAATAPDLSFGLKATRRESDTQAAEHTVGFEITARW